MRLRPVMMALVLLATMAQAACSAPPTLKDASPSELPSTTASPASLPSKSPVPGGPFLIGDVKPSRFLQVADLGSGPYVGHESPMEPARRAYIIGGLCATSPASEGSVIERVTMASTYQIDGRPGGVEEIITRYRAGGAAQYFAEIAAAVTTCARVQHSESVWSEQTTVSTGFAGDDSILIKQDGFSPPTTYSSGHTISYQAVVRGGDAILILVVSGWESSNPQREHVDQLIQSAVARASD